MPSEKRIPVMPMETHAIAVDAWRRSVRAEERSEYVAEEVLKINTGMLALSGEIAAFATEAARDRLAAQDDRQEMRRQMRALTESMRHVRKNTSSDSEEQIRNELPTLPEILTEANQNAVKAAQAEISRHSDAKRLGRYNWFEKTLRDGGAETIKHIVSLILIGVLGWCAHAFLGTSEHHRVESIPQLEHRDGR